MTSALTSLSDALRLATAVSVFWLTISLAIFLMASMDGHMGAVSERQIARARKWLRMNLDRATPDESAERSATTLFAQCTRWRWKTSIAVQIPIVFTITIVGLTKAAIVASHHGLGAPGPGGYVIVVLAAASVFLALTATVLSVIFEVSCPPLSVATSVMFIATIASKSIVTPAGRSSLIRRLSRLSRVTQRLFLIFSPAGDDQTRELLGAVSATLSIEIVNVKRAIMLDPENALTKLHQMLWRVLAAASSHPGTLAEAATQNRHGSSTAARRRLLTQTSSVLVACIAVAAVSVTFALDQTLGGNIVLAAIPVALAGATWLIKRGWFEGPLAVQQQQADSMEPGPRPSG